MSEQQIDIKWGPSKDRPNMIQFVLSTEMHGKPYHYIKEVPAINIAREKDRDAALKRYAAVAVSEMSVDLAHAQATFDSRGDDNLTRRIIVARR